MGFIFKKKNNKRYIQIASLMVFLGLVFFNFGSKAEAAPCWSLDNDQCNTELSTATKEKKKDFREISSTDRYKLVSKAFRFNLDCKKNDRRDQGSKCDNEEWSITLTDMEYTGDADFDVRNITLQLLHDNQSVIENDWKINQRIDSPVKLDANGRSRKMKLALILGKLDFEQLGAGSHSFTFSLAGKYEGYNHPQYFEYTFTFNVPRQLKISGLKKFDFRTFPEHKTTLTKTLCVYANGTGPGDEGGLFKIEASGLHENGQQKFNMKYGEKFIAYQPSFGVAGGSDFIILDGSSQDISQPGSRQKNCRSDAGKANMALKINIIEPFESLSRKLAGQYSDTITLIVSPR